MRPYHPSRALSRAGVTAAVLVALCLAPHQAKSAERVNCFSDVCPGDPPTVLNTIALTDLSHIAARGSAAAGDLEAALPDSSSSDRKAFAGLIDEDGRFLIDQKTLPMFLRIKSVCAPIAPFIALFTSESGHPTSVAFDMIGADGDVRFGVKTIRRTFRAARDTPAYVALLADLSAKFGFKVGAEPVHQGADGVSVSYSENDQGFRLSFAMPDLKNRNARIASQSGCIPRDRVKID